MKQTRSVDEGDGTIVGDKAVGNGAVSSVSSEDDIRTIGGTSITVESLTSGGRVVDELDVGEEVLAILAEESTSRN